jgi:hypothetical protein
MEIITLEEYNDFLLNDNSINLKNIFINLFIFEEDKKDYNDSMYVKFCKELERHYFNDLINNFFVFNTNDIESLNDLIYTKLKNNDFNLKNTINKIFDFILSDVFLYTSSNENKLYFNNFNQNIDLYDDYNQYLSIFEEKKIRMKYIYDDDKYEINQLYLLSLIDDFFINLNDDMLFNKIKNNPLFINKNDSIYLSDYFIEYLSFIFFIEKKGLTSSDIQYNQNFLDNFYFLCFNENL